MADLPPVPLTIEGSSLLHQMFRLRWSDWRRLSAPDRDEMVAEASGLLRQMEQGGREGSALYSLLGHKGDLMMVHFRSSFQKLEQAQRCLRKLRLFDYLEAASSYLSMVELGLYESTQKVYSSLAGQGIEPFSPEWNQGIEETLQRQREAMAPRLWPEIPGNPYL